MKIIFLITLLIYNQMTISIDFQNEDDFNKTINFLKSKNKEYIDFKKVNNDSFLLNISMNIEGEKQGREIEHDLSLLDIKYKIIMY